MRKICNKLCSAVTAFLLMLGVAAQGVIADSAETVIEISTPKELQDAALSAMSGATKGITYRLTEDLDFSNYAYVWGTCAIPFGLDSNPFCGTFDGNGHIIKNLKIAMKAGDQKASGLFGALGDGAVVKDLGMENTSVTNHMNLSDLPTAALAGEVSGTVLITDCYLRGTTFSNRGDNNVSAGFVFFVNDGADLQITNCYAVGTSPFTNGFLRGEFFAWSANGTEKITLTNCYTSSNQLAPKNKWTTAENCWANSEAAYNGWNNYNTWEWFGTPVSSAELKTKHTALGSAFKENTSASFNGGYPVLVWETIVESGGGDESTGQKENNAQNPTVISTAEEFWAINAEETTEGHYYKLANDLDLAGAVWTPVGSVDKPFIGVFDGNGHTISNFKVEATEEKKAYGLFGCVGGNGTVTKLGVRNADLVLTQITYEASGGAIAGMLADNAVLSECYAENIAFSRTSNTGNFGFAGGLAGRANGDGVEVLNSFVKGYTAVEGTVNNNAGLIGLIEKSGTILENCYSDTTLSRCDDSVTPVMKNTYRQADGGYIGWAGQHWLGEAMTEETNLGDRFLAETNGPVLKLFKYPGQYNNLIPNGTMSDDCYLFDNDNAKLLDGRTIESDKQGHKLQTPYADRTSKVLKTNNLTVPVALEQGKYYKISFNVLGDLPDWLGTAGFSLTLDGENLMSKLADQNIYYYGWDLKSLIYTPTVSGTKSLCISSDLNLYLDDLIVEELNGTLEAGIAADKLTLAYLAVDVLDNDLYLDRKTADGVEISYRSEKGYLDGNGKRTDLIPVGWGVCEDTYIASIVVAGTEGTKEFPIRIQERAPYKIQDIHFENADGKTVYDLNSAKKMEKIAVEKNTAENAELISAFYEGNRLSAIKTAEITESGEITVDLEKGNADSVKLYVLEQDTLRPLAQKKTTYPELDENAKVTVYTIGDSICADYAAGDLLKGWGQMLGAKFDETHVTVDNSRALAGMWAANFLSSGRFSYQLSHLKANDYVLIQLAHNDKDKYPIDDYITLLSQFVAGAKQKGAIPVFVTSPESRTAASDTLLADGTYQVSSMLKGYPEAMKQFAAENGVPMVDLNQHMRDLMAEKGKTGVTEMGIYATERNDDTHYTEKGANYLADFVSQEMKAIGLPVGVYVK